jgi:hypothetical protein
MQRRPSFSSLAANCDRRNAFFVSLRLADLLTCYFDAFEALQFGFLYTRISAVLVITVHYERS